MARFLMIPHAPGSLLAHIAACSAVAGALRERGHEPIFAYGGDRPELLERAGFEWHRVIEAPGAMTSEWFESADDLERMLQSQVAVIERVDPAVCMTSTGIGGLAAEVTGLPQLALMHSLAGSQYGRPALRGWMLRDAVRHPTRLIGHLRARRARSKVVPVAGAIAELRRRRGLPPLERSAGLVGYADAVACTTAPILDPARDLPAHWSYVGPLDYGVAGGEAATSPSQGPRAYVSQGSSGSPELLRRAVAELSGSGLEVVANTGELCEAEDLQDLGPRVTASAIGDTRSELNAADVAVIAGGNMTAMQALLSGTPTVVLPRSEQQSAGALRAQRLETGIALWPWAARGAIARAANRLLRDESYSANARALAARLRTEWDGNANAAVLAESLIDQDRS